jgi:hypothetical protein
MRDAAPSVHLVDECLESQICLGGHYFPCVELLEGEDVQLDENVDGGRDCLVVGICDVSNALDFLTLLDLVEEHLGQVAWGHSAPEQCVVVEQRNHVRLAVQILELV